MAMISRLFMVLALGFVIEVSFANFAQSAAATYEPNGGEGSLTIQECAGACEFRCSETHHKKPCLLYCNKCCEKCLCVPSGTYGNKEECPCYNNWKTQEGKPKCP